MIANLTTAFPGAVVVEVDHSVILDPPTTAQKVAITRRRPAVRNQILTCTRCELSSAPWVNTPVPFVGRTPARWVIVGEAPGAKENRGGEPFVGPAGKLLREMIAEAGLAIDEAMIVNTVSCWPNGTPTEHQIRACAPNLHAQLDLAATPFVLLAGGVALWGFRPGLRVSHLNGCVFVQGGRVFMPILHPAYVLRNRKTRGDVVEALERFRLLVRGEVGPSALFGTRCATGCGGWVDHYDPEGIGWCEVHWPSRDLTPTEVAWKKQAEAAKKVEAAKKRAAARRQGRMG